MFQFILEHIIPKTAKTVKVCTPNYLLQEDHNLFCTLPDHSTSTDLFLIAVSNFIYVVEDLKQVLDENETEETVNYVFEVLRVDFFPTIFTLLKTPESYENLSKESFRPQELPKDSHDKQRFFVASFLYQICCAVLIENTDATTTATDSSNITTDRAESQIDLRKIQTQTCQLFAKVIFKNEAHIKNVQLCFYEVFVNAPTFLNKRKIQSCARSYCKIEFSILKIESFDNKFKKFLGKG